MSIEVQSRPTVSINDIGPFCVSDQGERLSADVSVLDEPDATFEYTWTGDVDSKLAEPILSISEPGLKTVHLEVVADNGCAAGVQTKEIMVNENPVAEIITQNLEVCEMTDLELSANASQSEDVAYTWSGTAATYISPSTGKDVIFSAPEVTVERDYKAVLTVENTITGCNSQAEKSILVHNGPDVSIGEDIELCIGQDTVLDPSIDFVEAPFESRWVLDTTELSNTESLNPRFTLPDNKSYQVGLRITDKNGCDGYDELTILPLENPIADAGIDRDVDWNQEFELYGDATGGTPGYQYMWQPEDSLTTSNTIQNPYSILRKSTRFVLYVEDVKGCYDYDSVLITVVGQPIDIKIEQQPEPLCLGDSVTLSAVPSGGSGEYAYEWFKTADSQNVIDTSKNITVYIESNTEFGVRVHSPGAPEFATAVATKTITVNSKPSLTVIGGPAVDLCLGSTHIIKPNVNGTPEYTYEWSDGSPITVDTETYEFNNSQTPGEHIINLQVTDALGCEDDMDVSITVHPLPIVDITPDDPYVCVNEDLLLSSEVSGNGTPPYSYVWSSSAGSSIVSMGENATFYSEQSGSYPVSLKVRDDYKCRAEAVELVVVNPYSSLSLPEYETVCAGDSLILEINPDDIPGDYDMQWVGGNTERIIDDSDVFHSVFLSDVPGEYELYYSIEDQYGCPRIDTINVTVYPPVTLAPIENQSACEGVALNLQADLVEGDPNNTLFSWNGQVTPSQGRNTTFKTSNMGTYEVEVTAGDNNCFDKTSFEVTVHPNPQVEIPNAPIMQVDYGAQVTLQGNIRRFTSEPYVFEWSDPLKIISGADSETATTKEIFNSVDYQFSITDKFGCSDTADITLQTELLIIEIVVPENPDDDPLVPHNEVIDPADFDLTPDTREMCIGDSVILIPQIISGMSDDLTYEWYDDDGQFISNTINIFVTPEEKYSSYTLNVTNQAGYTAKASYRVVAHPNPSAHIQVYPDYDGKYYIDDVFSVNGSPTGGSNMYVEHQWTADNAILNPDDKQITTMNVESLNEVSLTYKVVDSKGCEAVATKILPISEQPEVNINGNEACENSSVTYSLTESYPSGTLIVWNQSGGEFEGSHENVEEVSVHWPSPIENGEVWVDVYPPNDRPLHAEIDVTVGAYPDIEIGGPVHVCVDEHEKYIVQNNNSNSTNVTYSWKIASDIDNPLSSYYDEYWDGQNDSLLQNVSSSGEQASVHWKNEGDDKVVVIAREGGCFSTEDLDVHVHPLPQPDFEYESVEKVFFQDENVYRYTDSIFVDKQVDFSNVTFGALDTAVINDNVSFYWDFVGDGVYTENAFNTSYSYDESGEFTVNLMAVDEQWGCENVIAKPLVVVANPSCGLTFPNTITPDLSENGEFYPVYNQGVLERDYELRIYNRWGTLLWSTTDINETWDGTYKGEVAKQDVYVYHCRAVCEDENPETGEPKVLNIKGDVTVIR
ncbi:MAG: gliding motility-associated C-terminal domain-containing protein [Bacteroidales bacterium]